MTLTHLEDDYDHFYSPRFEVQVGPRTYREADGRISGLKLDTSIEKVQQAKKAKAALCKESRRVKSPKAKAAAELSEKS
jgi:hypothetical protein